MQCIKEENQFLEEMEKNNLKIEGLVKESKKSISQTEENSKEKK